MPAKYKVSIFKSYNNRPTENRLIEQKQYAPNLRSGAYLLEKIQSSQHKIAIYDITK